MPAIQPATIAARLQTQINDGMSSMKRFRDDSDFQLLRWQEEIGKLKAADPGAAALALALVAHMMGKIDDAESHFAQAEYCGFAPVSIGLGRLSVYANLCFASKALEQYRNFVDIKYMNLSDCVFQGGSCGAFQQAASLMKQAELAKVELTIDGTLVKLTQAAEALARWPVSDDQCARVIDAAGEVMRGHRLFWQDPAPKISVNSDAGTVAMRLRVDTTPAMAAQMTMETADKLIEQELDSLPFFVSFVGTQH